MISIYRFVLTRAKYVLSSGKYKVSLIPKINP